MTYTQKATFCTSDDQGQGEAFFWEDNNGKITKITKKINSPNEIEDIYKNFDFNDPPLDIEEFINFSFPSPFKAFGSLANNLFSPKLKSKPDPNKQHFLPKEINIEKHRLKLQEIQKRRQEKELKQQEKEEKIKYLQHQIEELKEIKKEFKKEEEKEGLKDLENDINILENEINNIKNS